MLALMLAPPASRPPHRSWRRLADPAPRDRLKATADKEEEGGEGGKNAGQKGGGDSQAKQPA